MGRGNGMLQAGGEIEEEEKEEEKKKVPEVKWSGVHRGGCASQKARLNPILFIHCTTISLGKMPTPCWKCSLLCTLKRPSKEYHSYFRQIPWENFSAHQFIQRAVMGVGVTEVFMSACSHTVCVYVCFWVCYNSSAVKTEELHLHLVLWFIMSTEESKPQSAVSLHMKEKLYEEQTLKHNQLEECFLLQQRWNKWLHRTKNDSPEWGDLGKDSIIRQEYQEQERRDQRETLGRVLGFINMKNSAWVSILCSL